MRTPTVALRFRSELANFNQMLGDEFIGLTAQIQAGLEQITDEINAITDTWTEVAFNSANYIASNGGTVTPLNQNPYTFRYKVIGKTMWLNVAVSITMGANTNEIGIKIPGGYKPKGITGLTGSGDYWQRTAGVWADGSSPTCGVTGVFVGVSDSILHVLRYDVMGEPDFPANTITTGFMITIPLV